MWFIEKECELTKSVCYQFQFFPDDLQLARRLQLVRGRIQKDWRRVDHEANWKVAGSRHLFAKQTDANFVLEERFPVEAWQSAGRTLHRAEIHHEPTFDWRQKVWLKNLRAGHQLPTINSLPLQIWFRKIYSSPLQQQGRRNSEHIYASDKRCNLKDSIPIRWKTWRKVGSQESQAVFDEQVRAWTNVRGDSSNLGLHYPLAAIGSEDNHQWQALLRAVRIRYLARRPTQALAHWDQCVPINDC